MVVDFRKSNNKMKIESIDPIKVEKELAEEIESSAEFNEFVKNHFHGNNESTKNPLTFKKE